MRLRPRVVRRTEVARDRRRVVCARRGLRGALCIVDVTGVALKKTLHAQQASVPVGEVVARDRCAAALRRDFLKQVH